MPESLRTLLRHQAIVIDSGADFRVHVQRLVESIKWARADRTKKEAQRAAAARVEAERLAAEAAREAEARRIAEAKERMRRRKGIATQPAGPDRTHVPATTRPAQPDREVTGSPSSSSQEAGSLTGEEEP